MSLADIVRSAVSIAHSVTDTGELQESITLERWSGQDDAAKPTYATGLSITALVDRKARAVRMGDGVEKVTSSVVTILKPFAALSPVVTGRREPVDERDKVTLADGSVFPILRIDGGLRDPDTGRPFLVQIFLG